MHWSNTAVHLKKGNTEGLSPTSSKTKHVDLFSKTSPLPNHFSTFQELHVVRTPTVSSQAEAGNSLVHLEAEDLEFCGRLMEREEHNNLATGLDPDWTGHFYQFPFLLQTVLIWSNSNSKNKPEFTLNCQAVEGEASTLSNLHYNQRS